MSKHQDCYFFDEALALQTARQQNRVARNRATEGIQLCYLGTEKAFPDAPPNLIPVPRKETFNYFLATTLRLPTRVEFPASVPQKLRLIQTQQFELMIKNVVQLKREKILLLKRELLARIPDPKRQEPLRVFCDATELTPAQLSRVRQLLERFAESGVETRLVTNDNPYIAITPETLLAEHWSFNPHLVLNVDRLNNEHLHPDIYNIVWWQETPKLSEDEQRLKWRTRDLAYYETEESRALLHRTGARHLNLQNYLEDSSDDGFSAFARHILQQSAATEKATPISRQRHFALFLPIDDLYGEFGGALQAEMERRGIRTTYIPAKGTYLRDYAPHELENIHHEIRNCGATDIFTINLFRSVFRFQKELPVHVWVQDLPQFYDAGVTDERIMVLLHQWKNSYPKAEFFPPFTSYSQYYRPPNGTYRFDISFAGYLPRQHWAPTGDPLLDQQIEALFEVMTGRIRTEKFFEADWDGAERLLSWAEQQSGQVLRGERMRKIVVRYILQSLARRIQRADLGNALIDICRRNRWSLAIAGHGWQRFPTSLPFLQNYIAPGRELARFYQESRINIHVNGDTNVHPRVIECLACGAFVLPQTNATDSMPGGLNDVLDSDVYPTFADPRDLEEQLGYYLEHSTERERITHDAGTVIRSKFTIQNAADLILNGNNIFEPQLTNDPALSNGGLHAACTS